MRLVITLVLLNTLSGFELWNHYTVFIIIRIEMTPQNQDLYILYPVAVSFLQALHPYPAKLPVLSI